VDGTGTTPNKELYLTSDNWILGPLLNIQKYWRLPGDADIFLVAKLKGECDIHRLARMTGFAIYDGNSLVLTPNYNAYSRVYLTEKDVMQKKANISFNLLTFN